MRFQVFAFAFIAALQAQAVKLADYSPYDYQVFFTNPICEEYFYSEPVYAVDGTVLRSKPKNAYCKGSDFDANKNRESSPHYNLLKLLRDKSLKSVFLAFLSFSSDEVEQELCEAVKRNVKVSFIIDSKNERRSSARSALDALASCKPENLAPGEKANLPETFFRGNLKGIGYAHNKIIIAEYADQAKIKLVYGSGNMSSGTILHHENWHFVTTNRQTFLAQSHFCVKEAMLQSGNSRKEYKQTFSACRDKIESPEEEDIQMMVVPTDGKRAMANIVDHIKASSSVDVAVHRFTHPDLINGMSEAAKAGKRVRLVADDDIYWTGVRRQRTGANMWFEYNNAMKVVKAGVDIRYVQSNQNHRLLHHNKYIIFNYPDGSGALHAGAGNFTKAAFTKNMENYYFIKIPEVVAKFREQYEYKYQALATPYEKMPKEYVMP